MFPMTTWVKRLLIANVVVFILVPANTLLYQRLWLYVPWVFSPPYQIWGVFTYMFLHAGLGHLFFNMLGLFFFGPRLEQRLGARDFLWLYFLSGIGGAVFTFLFARDAPVVGASGAVYGVILAFALFWPKERIYLWAVLPVEARLLAAIMIGGSLYSGIAGSNSGTAHFAHLGGLAFGWAFLRWQDHRSGSARREFKRKAEQSPVGTSSDRIRVRRWEAIDVEDLHELNREEVIALLAKVKEKGIRSLSDEERRFLDRMAASSGLGGVT